VTRMLPELTKLELGRKFWLSVSVTGVLCLLYLFGRLDQNGFLEGLKFATGAYLSANVLHRLTEAVIEFYKEKVAS